MSHRDGHHEASACPHRCDKWDSYPHSTRSSNGALKCGPTAAATDEKAVAEGHSTGTSTLGNLCTAAPPAAPAAAPPAPASPELAPPSATPHTASCALLLQTTEIPAETARLVRCHNPWPTEDVYFCPEDALPAFVTGIPALSSGPELWIAIHNHRPEPLRLHSGQNIGVLKVMTLEDTPPATSQPSPVHQPRCQSISHRSSTNS